MKVIDLLNKIANGEELPIRIKINGYEYRQSNGQFWCDELEAYLINDCASIYCLNEEVEIIEEEKKIPEKIDLAWQNSFDEQVQQDCIKMIIKNINEILDYLQSKGDE